MANKALAAVALALALMLTGCTAGPRAADREPVLEPAGVTAVTPLVDLPVLEDPKSFTGASTALLAEQRISAPSESPEQHLPVEIMSHDLSGDIPVTITTTSRVIAMDLSGTLAATVRGLGFGDTLVGRDISTTFAEAADLPVVTGAGHTINVESVIALEPDVVITDGTIGPIDVVTQLRDVGIVVVFVERQPSFDGAVQTVRDVAGIFGADAAGEAVASQLDEQIATVQAEIKAIAPSGDERLRMVFLYLRGASGIYYLFGSESGADDLITAVGGIDVASELGWTGMRALTDEALVEADPDLIIVMTSGLESVGGVAGLLEAKPAIALTTAGQHQRIVDMADGQVLSFGPRSADVLDALARAIYAPNAS